MKTDFTVETYRELLEALVRQGFCFQAVEQFMREPLGKVVILRHDVDALPRNSLQMAFLEQELGAVATYYFRAVPESWDEGVIRDIAAIGHEVGYHYENVDAVVGGRRSEVRIRKDEERLYKLAYEDFCRNLERLRKLVPVKTICMHGSPLSRLSNLELWKRYDYQEQGIIGEPYLDVNFDEVFYVTDTGRRWDGDSVSVRDKVKAGNNDLAQRRQGAEKRQGKFSHLRFHSTFDIIEAVEAGRFPDKAMITVHPQRWTDDPFQWAKELVWQNCKNLVKRVLISRAESPRRKGKKVRG